MDGTTRHAVPPSLHPSLVDLVRGATMDAELAAIAWLLVEARIPLVIATPPGRLRAGAQLLEAILGSVRPDVDLADLQAPLGAAGAGNLVRGRRPAGVLEASSLEEVRQILGGPPLPLDEDALSFLGLVLVLGREDGDASAAGALRVVVAHYVRPLARDAHGHAQRLPPAVVATWDVRTRRYEHFAWGVLPEIAARLGLKAGDLDRDLHHRRDDLAGLAKAGVTSLEEVRRLIAGYRVEYGQGHGAGASHDGGRLT
jgi:hypothetical protein